MRWVILSCKATRHIRPAQEWLFKKYAPTANLIYIDLDEEPVSSWGLNVLRRLPNDEMLIFGLDDYLPIDYLDVNRLRHAIEIVQNTDVDRFELSWGAVYGFNKNRHITDQYNGISYLRYPIDGLYTVSCQFSIWKTRVLRELLKVCGTPWNFEKSLFTNAACFREPVFRWIEESALSGRHPGKINVLGLRHTDLNELINLGLIDQTLIQYGMPRHGRVDNVFNIEKAGSKYRKFYE